MQIRSDAFDADDPIPEPYSRDAADESPPLRWSELPRDTRALALVVEDIDAPNGGVTHWLLWNIPVTSRGLGEGVPHRGWFSDEMRQGENDFGELGWTGPSPPKGEQHRYRFHLFALDGPLPLEDGAKRDELVEAMRGHVLDEAVMTAHYPE